LNISDNATAPVCGYCKSVLSLSVVEEVIAPENIVIVKEQTPAVNSHKPPEKTSEGGYCGCLIFFALLLLVSAPGGNQLNQTTELQKKRIDAIKEKEIGDSGRAQVSADGVLLELAGLVNLKRKHKGWRKLKESDKAVEWNMIYQKCKEMNVSAEKFWQEFGGQITEDFSLPPKTSFDKTLSRNKNCPFSIKTRDPESLYYVKLKSLQGNKEIALFFKGSYFETKVPPGIYRFCYGYGKAWYGPVFLFGPEKNFFESDQLLEFSEERDSEGINYRGHSIELIKQVHGNFHTKTINEDDF